MVTLFSPSAPLAFFHLLFFTHCGSTCVIITGSLSVFSYQPRITKKLHLPASNVKFCLSCLTTWKHSPGISSRIVSFALFCLSAHASSWARCVRVTAADTEGLWRASPVPQQTVALELFSAVDLMIWSTAVMIPTAFSLMNMDTCGGSGKFRHLDIFSSSDPSS